MSENDVWKESGAIIYIAVTVLIFVFLVLIAVWTMTRIKRKRYSQVEEEEEEDSVELVMDTEEKINEFTIDEDSEEDIELYSDNLPDDQLEAV